MQRPSRTAPRQAACPASRSEAPSEAVPEDRPRGRRSSRRGLVAPALVLFLLAAALPAPGAGPGGGSARALDGSWRLIEQRYAGGAANLAFDEAPVRLQFATGKEGTTGLISAGEGAASAALPWPAFPNDEGPLPVTVLDRSLDPAKSEVRAHYRVRPSPSDDLTLDVEERYAVSEDGRFLVGDMTVRFRQGEADRGSFTLHRRFEREP